MKKIRTAFCCIALISTVFSVPAMAVELENINISGYEMLTEETKLEIGKDLEKIPQFVFDYYKKEGGKIEFIDEELHSEDHSGDSIKGLYYINNHKIQIRADMETQNNPNTSISKALLHEIGHFLYHEVLPYTSEVSRETIKREFAYWKQYSPNCYNEDETFAWMYAIYYEGSIRLSNNAQEMFKEVEERCTDLLAYDGEKGPGMFLN